MPSVEVIHFSHSVFPSFLQVLGPLEAAQTASEALCAKKEKSQTFLPLLMGRLGASRVLCGLVLSLTLWATTPPPPSAPPSQTLLGHPTHLLLPPPPPPPRQGHHRVPRPGNISQGSGGEEGGEGEGRNEGSWHHTNQLGHQSTSHGDFLPGAPVVAGQCFVQPPLILSCHWFH